MPTSKANQRAVNKYVKNNYDRINVTFPKGKKESIQAHAAALGESTNGFITRVVGEAMERDAAPAPAGVPAPAGIEFPPEALEAARSAARATGETLEAFTVRAVEQAAESDRNALAIGLNPAESWTSHKAELEARQATDASIRRDFSKELRRVMAEVQGERQEEMRSRFFAPPPEDAQEASAPAPKE